MGGPEIMAAAAIAGAGASVYTATQSGGGSPGVAVTSPLASAVDKDVKGKVKVNKKRQAAMLAAPQNYGLLNIKSPGLLSGTLGE